MNPHTSLPTPQLNRPDTPIRVILDTDPGIDAALAILLAGCSAKTQIDGMTIGFGNCTVEQAAVNADSDLELWGSPQIPVYHGAERTIFLSLELTLDSHSTTDYGYTQFIHPSTRVQSQPAVTFLIEHIVSHSGKITLVMLGPLTNLARAMRLELRIIPDLRQIFVMGSAIQHPGNVSALAENNIACVPHAARILFHDGVPLTLLPLDVTYQAKLTPADVDRLLQIESPISQIIADATRCSLDFHAEHQGIQGCAIHDPLALAVVFTPYRVPKTLTYVDVDLSGGVSMGKTYGDLLNTLDHLPNIEVALSVNARAFMDFFHVSHAGVLLNNSGLTMTH